jgi:chemotaxis signal transduction protein
VAIEVPDTRPAGPPVPAEPAKPTEPPEPAKPTEPAEPRPTGSKRAPAAPAPVFTRPAPRRSRDRAARAAAATVPVQPPAQEQAPSGEQVPASVREQSAAAVEPSADPVPAARPATGPATVDEAAPAVATELAAVVVRLGGTRYALDMDAVAEVGRVPRVTRLPGMPSWVAGVANWRGRVLAVVDLRPLLSAPAGPLGTTARVVVLSRAGLTVGMLAEAVEGVAEIDSGCLGAPLSTLSSPAASLLAGQVVGAGGPVAVLDPDAVFALRDQLPRVRRAG